MSNLHTHSRGYSRHRLSTIWIGFRGNYGKPAFGNYQMLGDLIIEFRSPGHLSDYQRELDLEQGIARVSYRIGDVLFTANASTCCELGTSTMDNQDGRRRIPERCESLGINEVRRSAASVWTT